MNEKLNQAVQKGVGEVIASLFGQAAAASAPVERSIDGTGAEITVVLAFVGELSGAFTLKASLRHAAAMASAMLGMTLSEDSPDVRDAAGELLNMMAGSIKRHFSPEAECFKLSVPTTISGKEYIVFTRDDTSDMVTQFDFTWNGHSFSLEVYLK